MLKGIPHLLPVINNALRAGATFAVCAPPGDDRFRVFLPDCPASAPSSAVFEIGPWLMPYSRRITIGNEVSSDEARRRLETLPDAPASSPLFSSYSTPQSLYIANVSSIIASCRRRKGKSVYSRVITGKIADGMTWATLFEALCQTFPQTFRFIFYTSGTGGWMGATPELLLHADFTAETFRTVALAGTRPRSVRPWDTKNIHENLFVSRYITAKVRHAGLRACVSPPYNVAYGTEIEHLCREISGTLPAGEYEQLFDAINPTPALCGFPKQRAIADLKRYEPHSRGCYGGFVALRDSREISAFVTLRCIQFGGPLMRIYAGGGITSESVPAKEWTETESKCTFFRRYLKNIL